MSIENDSAPVSHSCTPSSPSSGLIELSNVSSKLTVDEFKLTGSVVDLDIFNLSYSLNINNKNITLLDNVNFHISGVCNSS